MFYFRTCPDGNVDIAKASLVAGIAPRFDLCAHVPVEGIMYLLADHCGADDVVLAMMIPLGKTETTPLTLLPRKGLLMSHARNE
jgi:hypothetical protein